MTDRPPQQLVGAEQDRFETVIEEFRVPVAETLLQDSTFIALVELEANVERIVHNDLALAVLDDSHIAVTTFDTGIHALELIEDTTHAYAIQCAEDVRSGQQADESRGMA